MDISSLNGSDIKTLCVSESKLWLGLYFITYDLRSEADNTLHTLNTAKFDPKLNKKGRKVSIPVFRYNSDGSLLIECHPSLRHCVKTLHGDRNYNTNSIKLRILNKELYLGYLLTYTPLSFDSTEEKY